MAVDGPSGSCTGHRIITIPAVIIWLLSGVKQTKEATEAARYLQARLEVKIGTAGALRPQHPLHYARIRGWSRDGRTRGPWLSCSPDAVTGRGISSRHDGRGHQHSVAGIAVFSAVVIFGPLQSPPWLFCTLLRQPSHQRPY